MPLTTTVELRVDGVAAGGDGVARDDDGRVVFVRGALPGERVAVAVVDERKSFARGEVVEVLEASADRVAPGCAHVAEGCGGCGWQHVDVAAQRRLKATIVDDALRRIGRVEPPEPDLGPDLPAGAHRTTVRAGVDAEGRAGLHVHHGHDLVLVGDTGCPVAHPLVDGLLRGGRFHGATAVTVRAGARTGERLVLADPSAAGVVLPDASEGVVVAGTGDLAGGRRAWFHEEVAGRRWRISATSFFQARPDGDDALVDAVLAAAPATGGRVVDLYAGVGLLGGAVAAAGDAAVTAVEANRAAAADARANLADLPSVRVVRADVRRWRPSPADVVVADPSRHGLGADVVARIAATGAGTVVVVSCDAAALGRDAGLLTGHGYRLATWRLVDLFPHTPHVEVVTGWRRD